MFREWVAAAVLLQATWSASVGLAAPAEPTGAELYRRYCASCHGISGRGDGPVAGEMRQAPPDLTTIAARAEGHFDERALMAVIDGRRAVSAHGPRDMPVWGAVFDEELKKQSYPRYTSLLRAKVLAEYLRSIQR